MNSPKFVALHTHSTFSFRDGMGTPEQIADRLIDLNQTGCAITDHGNTFAHVPMYHTFKKRGLHLVLGVEFYHCADLREKGGPVQKKDEKQRRAKSNHITVLAKNEVGYRNLLKLVYLSNHEGYHYDPRIDWTELANHQEGLIVLSGCLGGRISQNILAGKEDVAFAQLRWAKEHIANFYVEVLPCPDNQDSERSCTALWQMADELQLPVMITDDAHFPRPEDHRGQEALLCSNYRYKLHDEKTRTYRIAPYHFHHDGAMMFERCRRVVGGVRSDAEIVAAIERSATIAEACNVELKRCNGPLVTVPKGLMADDYLVRWVEKGKAYRRSLGLLPEEGTPEWEVYEKRAQYELDIIRHHQFANYFLLIIDIVQWSRKENVWCIARGSAGGSLLCYYLQITQIDPIRHKLPVERFIDYSRSDMPDIDIDFDARYRERVFEYLESKYGREHCAQIAALSRYRARQAVRDIGDICDLPATATQQLLRLLPELDDEGEGIKATGHLARLFNEHPQAQALLAVYPDLKLAAMIEGQIRQQTIHAAGFVVDQAVLAEVIGVVDRPKHARVVACDKDYASLQGLLKFDALSVNMLSAIAEMLTALGKDVDWLYRLPLDDAETYQMLCLGRNMGVFQMKGHTTGRLLTQLQPTEFSDLVALAALGRPGPLQSGGTQDYIDRKHGRKAMPAYHPLVMNVLAETYGVVIYQEQVMQIATDVGGLSVADAHKIRKLISKSGGTAALEKYHEPYLKGAAERDIREEEAEAVWRMCQEAGDYVFNKAHGAQYAQVGYWSAYLKCHYPTQFAVHCANHEMDATFRRQLLREFKQQGGRLELLHYNHSKAKFSSAKEGVIVGGFGTLHGCGPVHSHSLEEGQPYRDWHDFLRRCPGTIREALVASGVHTGKVDLDVALAIAPWFVEIEFSDFEQEAFTKGHCEPIEAVLSRLEHRAGSRVALILGRITDLSLSNTKKAGKPGKTAGTNESVTLSVSDPTGSLDVRFAGWKVKELFPRHNPLTGPLNGVGNTVWLQVLIAEDYSRVYGENIRLIRESKGYLPEAVQRSMAAQQRGETIVQERFDLEG